MSSFNQKDIYSKSERPKQTFHIDAKGSQCPGPIMALADSLKYAQIDDTIEIEVTDEGFNKDVVAWCHGTGNELLSINQKDNVITAVISIKRELKKGGISEKENAITVVIFNEEMDRGLAAFNIILGALAMGMKVNVFFTFWGLELIRKKAESTKPSDDDVHIPQETLNLPLSHTNLFGIGRMMMEHLMKKKHVPSLNFMIHLAKFEGVHFIACQMSMEIMNIKPEELINNIEVAGVASMLEYANKSTINYFI